MNTRQEFEAEMLSLFHRVQTDGSRHVMQGNSDGGFIDQAVQTLARGCAALTKVESLELEVHELKTKLGSSGAQVGAFWRPKVLTDNAELQREIVVLKERLEEARTSYRTASEKLSAARRFMWQSANDLKAHVTAEIVS